MSRYHDLEADLQLLNLEFAESDFAKFQGPIFDERWMWNLNPDWMNNAFGNQELNHAIQLSEYLQQQSNYRIEDVSPQPACLYEPAPIPNFVDIPGPVGAEFDVESTLFRPDGEMHSKINSAHLNLLDEVGTALPTACGSHMVNIQEPMKRGRGRPKGSKTKQHHPSKPKTPEEKAQAKLDKAAIRLANKKACREAKEMERKANAAAKKKAKQTS